MQRASLLLFLGLTACNAQIAQVLASEDAGATPLEAGSPKDAGTTEIDATTSFDAGNGDSDGGPAPGGICSKDQDCNDDQSVNALWGTCFMGQCFCKSGNSIQPDGKCAPGNPPGCTSSTANQSTGTCRQNPAECQQNEMQGSYWSTMTCGDLVPVVCCIEKTKCTSFFDVVCCGASSTPYEPVCVNGWKTCDPGAPTPRVRGNAGCQ